ncbi:PqqD family protein [Streptomyces sp. NPDC004111]|uniref:PqqD family protein n=1 Tax=Streptomyces sp. NPDC004111 TaxID=3364690 RepID=UPI0036C1F23A
MSTARDVPRRTLGVPVRRVSGELVLGVQDEALELSGTARVIYESVDGRRTVAEVVDTVAAVFGAAAHEVFDDVAGFLDELAAQAVVEWSPPGGPGRGR